MTLRIQDPLFEESYLLHETLLNEASRSKSGAGAFAFASKDGIDLLFGDAAFSDFLSAGSFTLIVGLDSITNVAAVEELKKLEGIYHPNLVVKAFVNSLPGSTFHPKFTWFDREDSAVTIVGSGNLTHGGLRNNREAYSVCELSPCDFDEIKHYWERWIDSNSDNLRSIDDDEVLRLAEENGRHKPWKRPLRKIKSKSGNPAVSAKSVEAGVSADDYDSSQSDLELEESFTYWLIDHETDILLAEIPKSGNRWKQANFSKEIFTNFFGATCFGSDPYRILLRSVDACGALGALERRQSVSVSSNNWRFELEAAAGLDYPTDGRPIGVFAKTGTRAFLYQLVMPGDPSYDEVDAALNTLGTFSKGSMRRKTSIAGEVYPLTKSLAIWSHLL